MQFWLQSRVLPQPSSNAAEQLFALAHVSGVHPQTPDWQGPLAQSASPVQALPGAHLGHVVPPQSTSVSVPFLALSVHVGSAVQVLPLFEYPVSHVKSHCPALHVACECAGAAGQATHEPQPFVGDGVTHVVPHSFCPPEHVPVPPVAVMLPPVLGRPPVLRRPPVLGRPPELLARPPAPPRLDAPASKLPSTSSDVAQAMLIDNATTLAAKESRPQLVLVLVLVVI